MDKPDYSIGRASMDGNLFLSGASPILWRISFGFRFQKQRGVCA
jgi:hypothetical protein